MAELRSEPSGLVWFRRRRMSWAGILPLALVLGMATALRLYGVNWDAGLWLHPDERQIYFIANGLGWPQSLSQALSPRSPLNPNFFAYGSFPIYLLRAVAILVAPLAPALRDPGNLHLVGRALSALLDVGAVYLTYRLVRVLEETGRPAGSSGGPDGSSPADLLPDGKARALLAATLLALSVLAVQAAHFYTADTVLTFLIMLSLNLAAGVGQGAGRRWQVALGVVVGLALATKLAAAPLAVVVAAAYAIRSSKCPTPQVGKPMSNTSWALVTAAIAGCVFLLVQPYAVIDLRTFVADTVRESQIAWGRLDVPYTRQYAGTWPYLYSMWQMALWGLGLVPGLVAWLAFLVAGLRWLRRGLPADGLLLAWAVPYLALVGLLHARYLRYMLPLLPTLCILVARLPMGLDRHQLRAEGQRAWRTEERLPSAGRLGVRIGALVLLAWSLVYTLAFVRIYSEPHSWVTASEWVYRNLPEGTTVAVEEWDTPLPLPLEVDGQARRIDEYDVRTLLLNDEPDDTAKWSALAAEVSASDYLIIASRRVYGPISRLPDLYPLASRYYELLFSGQLGFELAGEFTRGPDWLNLRVGPLPGAAPILLWPDESFVVYDHPRALVLRNVGHLPPSEIVRRLTAP